MKGLASASLVDAAKAAQTKREALETDDTNLSKMRDFATIPATRASPASLGVLYDLRVQSEPISALFNRARSARRARPLGVAPKDTAVASTKNTPSSDMETVFRKAIARAQCRAERDAARGLLFLLYSYSVFLLYSYILTFININDSPSSKSRCNNTSSNYHR